MRLSLTSCVPLTRLRLRCYSSNPMPAKETYPLVEPNAQSPITDEFAGSRAMQFRFAELEAAHTALFEKPAERFAREIAGQLIPRIIEIKPVRNV